MVIATLWILVRGRPWSQVNHRMFVIACLLFALSTIVGSFVFIHASQLTHPVSIWVWTSIGWSAVLFAFAILLQAAHRPGLRIPATRPSCSRMPCTVSRLRLETGLWYARTNWVVSQLTGSSPDIPVLQGLELDLGDHIPNNSVVRRCRQVFWYLSTRYF
jgi:hypothetical protein